MVVHSLKEPEVCYDYSLKRGQQFIAANDKREFSAFGTGDISIAVALQSTQSDFSMLDSRVKVTTKNLKHKESYYSPSYTNAYLPAIETNTTTHEIAIGDNIKKSTAQKGGEIKPTKRYYSKFVYAGDKAAISDTFDIDLNVSIDLSDKGKNYVTHLLTTNEDKLNMKDTPYTRITRCPQSPRYNPKWGTFNVERPKSNQESAPEKYTLFTQVAGKKFDMEVVHYNNPDNLKEEIALEKQSVELELINVSSFVDENSTFRCENPDPDIVQEINGKKKIFTTFNNSSRALAEDIRLTSVLRNAAFRVWFFEDENGTLIEHGCQEDEGCYAGLYEKYYKKRELQSSDMQFCKAPCSNTNQNCYECLKQYYAKPLCSRDNFSVRPLSYRLSLADSNRSIDDDAKVNVLATNDEANTNTQANLVAGYPYKLQGFATMLNGGNTEIAKGYRVKFGNSKSGDMYSTLFSDFGSKSCVDDNDTAWNIYFDDGEIFASFTGEDVNVSSGNLVDHNNIGEYRYELYDNNWTIVDQSRFKYKTFKDTNDCVVDEHKIDNAKNGKQGCAISSKLEGSPDSKIYNHLYLRYYPYTFNVDGLGTGAGTDNTKEFVYINTLADAPNGKDENMSYNVFGTFSAATYTGDSVNNFVDGCYADPVDMTLYHTYLTDIPSATPYLSYDLLDYNTSIPRKNDTPTTYDLEKNTKAPLKIAQPSAAFVPSMQGSIKMDLGFNFNRTNNNPLNPRRILFSDFNITYSGSPELSVDMKTDYKIYGNKKITETVDFFYARAKTQQSFYDDIAENSVITPISVVLYCDLGFTECQNRGIMAAFAQTNESNWWKSWNHFSPTDGTVRIQTTKPGVQLNRTTANLGTNAEDNTIGVNRDDSLSLPTIVPVNLETDPTVTDYTNRWLIYNQDDDTLPDPFYKVRFIGGSGWAGHGAAGHVVDGESNVKKSKRLEW
ncbi:MAG: hypothetical protein L3J43_04365 [Sulfurovum sp.]|nr:hypothetical protein [Sulfurovum sp.]